MFTEDIFLFCSAIVVWAILICIAGTVAGWLEDKEERGNYHG